MQKPALSVAQLAAQPPAVTAAVAAQPAVARGFFSIPGVWMADGWGTFSAVWKPIL